MFRFFKLYSLYMNNMDKETCVCLKLPRAILHVPVDHYNFCELCGLYRMPRTCSSDEEEKQDAERQKILLQRRREEEASSNNGVRVKVSVKGKKPKSHSKRKSTKSGAINRTKGGGIGESGDGPAEPYKMCRRQDEPSAPPPSSPSPSGSPIEEMHQDFGRKRSIYDSQLLKKFIPLNGPITDPSGGAISKRIDSIWGASSLTSSPMQAKEKLQDGGSSSSKPKGKYTDSQLASQFPPFDEYDGPSEDALVVDSARRMLSRPNSLYMEPRPDLPNNRIGNYGSSLGRIWMAPSAPAPKIAKPPSATSNNDSPPFEKINADDNKEEFKSGDASSSSIYHLANAGEEAGKSEEQPVKQTEISEYEEMLQNLGLIKLVNVKEEATVNEDVISSNKTMTDEDYPQVLSMKKPTKIGGCSIERDQCGINVRNNKEGGPRESSGVSKIPRLESSILSNLEYITRRKDMPVMTNSTMKYPPSITSIKPIKVASIIESVTKKPSVKPVKRLSTNKLETFGEVYHMCGVLPMPQMAAYVREFAGLLSVSYVRKQPVQSVRRVLPRLMENSSRESNYKVDDTSSSTKTSIPHIGTPKGPVYFINQMKKIAWVKAIEKKVMKGEGCKSSALKCQQCQHQVRNKVENKDPRKITEDSEFPRKLQDESKKATKQLVCPIHAGKEKNHRCKGRIKYLTIPTKNYGKIETTIRTHKKFNGMLKTFGRVYHLAADLPKPQMASFVSELSEKLSESYVLSQPSKSFLEFRVPDVDLTDLKLHQEVAGNASKLETPIPCLSDPSIMQTKKKVRPVWPSMGPPGVYVHRKKKFIKKEIFTSIIYDQNSSQSNSLGENPHVHWKTMKTVKGQCMAIIEETELKRNSQVENRSRNPETSQASGNKEESSDNREFSKWFDKLVGLQAPASVSEFVEPLKKKMELTDLDCDSSPPSESVLNHKSTELNSEKGKECDLIAYLKSPKHAKLFKGVHGITHKVPFHLVTEGLPNQFSFNCEKMISGNTFVTFMLYTSLRKRQIRGSFLHRDYPLILLAAPDNKYGLPTGIIFWLLAYSTESKVYTKLSVSDPSERRGTTRIIEPRDITKKQNPQAFCPDIRDHILFKLSGKKPACVQICVVMEEDATNFRVS